MTKSKVFYARRVMRSVAFSALCLLTLPVMAVTGPRYSCDLVTRDEAERVLRQRVTGVVSGDEFCTYVSAGGPVFIAAMNVYDSEDKARDKMAADRRRRESEGKKVTNVDGIGQSALKAVSSRSIELTVLDGVRVIELAVAGDEVEPGRYEKQIGVLMKSLLSRRPA